MSLDVLINRRGLGGPFNSANSFYFSTFYTVLLDNLIKLEFPYLLKRSFEKCDLTCIYLPTAIYITPTSLERKVNILYIIT